MKKDTPSMGVAEEEPPRPANEETQDTDLLQGRNGEGAHSAMKHWLHEERNRLKRPEH
jgi:hypothetical protein